MMAALAPEEFPYLDVLAAARIPVVLIAPRAPRNLLQGWQSGPGRLTREVLRDRVPKKADRHAYVSGPPTMVNDVSAALRGLKVKKIKTNTFIGY